MQTVIWTIALSVLLHGVSAGPMSAWFARAEASPERRAAGTRCPPTPRPHAAGSDSGTTTGPGGKVPPRRTQMAERAGHLPCQG